MSYALAIEGRGNFLIERPARVESPEKPDIYWRLLTTLVVYSVQSHQETTPPVRFAEMPDYQARFADSDAFYLTALRSATAEPNAQIGDKGFQAVLLSLLRDFAEMMTEAHWDEECLKPTPRAQGELFTLVGDAFGQLPFSLSLPRPLLYPDGDGGLRLEWRQGNREISLALHRKNPVRDYLYHQEGDEHGLKSEVSSMMLAGWLRWLMESAK